MIKPDLVRTEMGIFFLTYGLLWVHLSELKTPAILLGTALSSYGAVILTTQAVLLWQKYSPFNDPEERTD